MNAEDLLRPPAPPPAKRTHADGPPALNAKMKRMVEVMIYGKPDDPEGAPCNIYEAAAIVGYRRKAARELSRSHLFVAELNREIAAFRNSEAARSIRTVAEIRDDRGENAAADRKVRLNAASMLLGDHVRPSGPGVTVNTTVVTPGYVIDLREPDSDAPLVIDQKTVFGPSAKEP